MFIDDFLTGMQICSEGDVLPDNASDDMKRGYAAEYELEQIRDFESEQPFGRLDQ